MQMRIPLFPHLAHTGMNMHMALPPFPPLVPLPVCGWIVVPTYLPGPLLYGKFSSNHVDTQAFWNTLFGHDWGLPGLHICLMPPTHTPTPSAPLVALGAGHKFWLPSYSVKEPASGGALAAIGGSATTAVAVTTAVGIILIQDCQDRNGIGFVLPIGINLALPTTHWVGFGWSDFFAGLAALAFDCIAAILLSKLANGKMFGKYGDLTKAFIGVAIGLAGATIQGLMSRFNAPPWLQIAVGIVLIGVDVHPKTIDHTGPPGAGLVGGGLADLIGGAGTSGDARGEHDPFFDAPAPPVAAAGTPQAPPPGTADGGAPDATEPPPEPAGPPPPPAQPEPNRSVAPPPDPEPNQSVGPPSDPGAGSSSSGGDQGGGGTNQSGGGQ